MFARVNSLGLDGLQGYGVMVECDLQNAALPGFDVVGLPDLAVKEAKDRVRSALKNAGFSIPPGKITINLAPADIRKVGSLYDLPIALAILTAAGYLSDEQPEACFLGELSLSGDVRPVAGVLPMAMEAEKQGLESVFLPWENRHEAGILKQIQVFPVQNIGEVYAHLMGKMLLTPMDPLDFSHEEKTFFLDFSEVKGQGGAKRALEIAAAGGHNLLMIGPPGAGKSMLAKRLPSILPPMVLAEAMETTKIYSVAGLLEKEGGGLIKTRPFRSPHHNTSATALSGGGSFPRPGEISLAHNGVLFLDELPEFSRDVLEVLRQPMEDREITISRARMTSTFPASLMVVAAMNPCPCGYYGHPVRQCTCSPKIIAKYLGKVSGPLLDRMDLHVEVAPVEFAHLTETRLEESSTQIRERVAQAKQVQQSRQKEGEFVCNAQLAPRGLKEVCQLEEGAQGFLEKAFEAMGLSARAYDKILKISRTIADLEGAEKIEKHHVAEAVQYRSLDRKYWVR